jgi:hypothetical protein
MLLCFEQVVLAPIAVGMLANKYLHKAVEVIHIIMLYYYYYYKFAQAHCAMFLSVIIAV